uniref:Uncharacterized protein n=1 Tax=Gongylonema pulchrum TaxID=637853 RepID=A0A183D6H1_9BILA
LVLLISMGIERLICVIAVVSTAYGQPPWTIRAKTREFYQNFRECKLADDELREKNPKARLVNVKRLTEFFEQRARELADAPPPGRLTRSQTFDCLRWTAPADLHITQPASSVDHNNEPVLLSL